MVDSPDPDAANRPPNHHRRALPIPRDLDFTGVRDFDAGDADVEVEVIDPNYTVWYGQLPEPDVDKVIKHCDQKINKYFAALDKKIEKFVKAEVKKYFVVKRKK